MHFCNLKIPKREREKQREGETERFYFKRDLLQTIARPDKIDLIIGKSKKFSINFAFH